MCLIMCILVYDNRALQKRVFLWVLVYDKMICNMTVFIHIEIILKLFLCESDLFVFFFYIDMEKKCFCVIVVGGLIGCSEDLRRFSDISATRLTSRR